MTIDWQARALEAEAALKTLLTELERVEKELEEAMSLAQMWQVNFNAQREKNVELSTLSSIAAAQAKVGELTAALAKSEKLWDESMLAIDVAEDDRDQLQAKLAEATRELGSAVEAERQRCLDIVSAARFGEVDQDFRAIHHMIEGGRTAEEIKS